MKRLLTLVFNFFSMSALAGYHCEVKLAHTEDLYKTIATKSITIETAGMKSGSLGTLFIESESKKKISSLVVRGVLDGNQGDEEMTLVIMRKEGKKKNTLVPERISENLLLHGIGPQRFWFDNYKLDAECEITE
jgi:hypothetical protein